MIEKKEMLKQLEISLESQDISNVQTILSSVEDFRYSEQFDIIICSGLLMYINDKKLKDVVSILRKHLKSNGIVIVREYMGIKERIVDIRNNQNYGIFRREEEFVSLFSDLGYKLIYKNISAPPNLLGFVFRSWMHQYFEKADLGRAILKFLLKIQLLMNPLLLSCKYLYLPLLELCYRKIESRFYIYRKIQ